MKQQTLYTLLRQAFIITLVPLVGAGLLAVLLGNAQIENTRTELLKAEADGAAARLQDIISHSENFVSLLALLQIDDETCSRAISAVRQPFEDAYAAIAVGGANGEVVCGHPQSLVGLNVADRDWFEDVIATERLVVSGYQFGRAAGEADMVVVRPSTFGPEEDPVYVGAAIRLEFLNDMLAQGGRSARGDIIILDDAGRTIATTNETLDLGQAVSVPRSDQMTTVSLNDAIQTAFVRDVDIAQRTFRVLAVAPPGGFLSVPEQIAGSLILAVMLIGLGTALYTARRLRRDVLNPVWHLRSMARAIAVGKDVAIPQTHTAPAEIQEAVTAFNDMARNLKQSSVELDLASDMAGLGTWRLRPGSDIIRVSRYIRTVLGFSDALIPLSEVEARILPEDLPAFRDALHRLVVDREIVEVEFRIRTQEGEPRIFLAQTGPLGDRDGHGREEMSGIVQDITDLRAREAALERTRGLFGAAGAVARLTGWRYEPSSGEFLEFSGPDATSSMSVETAFDHFAGEDRIQVERAFWACAAGGVPFDEIVRQKIRGEMRWVRVIGRAERTEDGEIALIHGAVQDIDELVRARETSAEMEDLLSRILDYLEDGFIVEDTERRIRYINWRAQVILGLAERRGLVGSTITDEVDPDLGRMLQDLIEDALDGRETRNRDIWVEGAGKWVEVSVYPTPSGIALYLRDRTRQREAQARLRLLDAAVARLNDMVVITKAETVDPPVGPEIVFVNDAFVKMTGFSREEAIGRTPRILQGEETERFRLEEVRMALENARPIRTELTNYRKDGTKFTLEIDIAPILDADGVCTHFVAVQRDTTERREAEERLRAREEQFRLVSQASNDIIWDWNLQTGTIWHSDYYQKVFGRPPDPSKSIDGDLQRIHPDDRFQFTKSLDDALKGDQSAWAQEYRIEAADGTYRQMMDRGFILRDDEGQPRRMVGAVTDVTEMRDLDERLHQSQKLEALGQLTGGIAHDFNNLLTVILGNCELLLDDLEDEEVRHSLEVIMKAAENGARLSSSLLAYSRRQQLRPRPTDFNELIGNSRDLLEHATPENIALEFELTDADVVSWIDPDKLQSALLNLVINSVAAIDTKGRIFIRTRRQTIEDGAGAAPDCPPGEYATIDVIDDGCGMSPEVAKRAFEPFFTTKDVGAGTGLGLSSVYGLVRQSGGAIDIETAPGQGTRISLCLPVHEGADDHASTQSHATGTRPIPRDGNRHILLVEDDEDVLAFASKCLVNLGYEVRQARSADAALELLEADPSVDLLLTDVVMPGAMSGLELAREARRRHPGLVIVPMSGYAEQLTYKEEGIAGLEPPLLKPFRAAQLAEKVAMALKDKRSGEEPD